MASMLLVALELAPVVLGRVVDHIGEGTFAMTVNRCRAPRGTLHGRGDLIASARLPPALPALYRFPPLPPLLPPPAPNPTNQMLRSRSGCPMARYRHHDDTLAPPQRTPSESEFMRLNVLGTTKIACAGVVIPITAIRARDDAMSEAGR
jgi:hypothetical protein